ERLLALLASFRNQRRGLGARDVAHLRALALRGQPCLLGLLTRLRASAIGLCVRGADGRQGLVPRRLGLHTRGLDGLLGLPLGRAHAVGRRPVGLRNPLAGPCLGVLAQLLRRAFGGLEDAGNPTGRVRRPLRSLGKRLRGGRLRLHGGMVEARRSAGRQRACEYRDGRKCWKSGLADGARLGHDRVMERTRSTPEVAMKPLERSVKSSIEPREVAILVYPGVQSLDVTGPLEVFAGAQALIDAQARAERPYRVRVLS